MRLDLGVLLTDPPKGDLSLETVATADAFYLQTPFTNVTEPFVAAYQHAPGLDPSPTATIHPTGPRPRGPAPRRPPDPR